MQAGAPVINLWAETGSSAEDLRPTLAKAGFIVTFHFLNAKDSIDRNAASLFLIDGGGRTDEALKLCHRLRGGSHDPLVPILYVTTDASPAARLACLEAGADTYLLRPFEPAELLAQVQALLRFKDRHDALSAKTTEIQRINKRLQAVNQQIDMELDLAKARIQESFLPQSLPARCRRSDLR